MRKAYKSQKVQECKSKDACVAGWKMKIRFAGVPIVFWLLAVSSYGAQSSAETKTPEVSLCELLKDPAKYDHLKIVIRGEISSEFEDFSIHDKSCETPRSPGIWLMFGGDVDCPTPSTWNDTGRKKGRDVMFQGAPYRLVKNEKFDGFHNSVTARKHSKSVYRTSALLEGTFFTGRGSEPSRRGTEHPGYGHLGCCYLYIIHQVLDFSADKIQ
jgi:hypothetical protein